MCYLRQTLLLAATLLFSTASWANCVKVTDNSFLSEAAIKAGYTARFWRGAFDDNIGHLGLPSVISVSANNKFQPSGTVLASTVGNFLTAGVQTPYTAKQVLYAVICRTPGSCMNCIQPTAITTLLVEVGRKKWREPTMTRNVTSRYA
ncbi:putative fimbriae; usher [Klebsiella michiganensis]|uniref:Putative fimbriae usher n=1 Tax=Klebsiella michiganensis TaxID=1134687 RepID=A0A7H4M6H0_9ENTR|nr:putative fimbriae; usher [Klebsiella michiganensis]